MTPAQRAVIANRFAHVHAARDRANGFGNLGGGPGAILPYTIKSWDQMRADAVNVPSPPVTGARPSDDVLLADKFGYLRTVLQTHDWAGVGRWYQFQIADIFAQGNGDAGAFWEISALNLRDFTSEPWTLNDWAAYVREVWTKYVIVDIGEKGKVGIGADPNQWMTYSDGGKLSTRTGVDVRTFWVAVTGFVMANPFKVKSGAELIYETPNNFPPANLGWIQAPGSGWTHIVFNMVAGAIIGAGIFAAYNAVNAARVAAQAAQAASAASAAAASAPVVAAAAPVATVAASAIPEIVVTASALPTVSTAAALTTAATGVAAGAAAVPTSAPSPSAPIAPKVEEVLVEAARATPSAVSPATVAAATGAAAAAIPALVNAPAATPSVDEIIVEAAKSPTVTPEQTAAATGATAGAANAVQQTQQAQQEQQSQDGKKEGTGGGALDTIKNLVEAISTLLTGGGAGGAGAGGAGAGSGINTGIVPVVKQPSALAKAAPWLLLALLVGAVAADQKRKRKNS